MALRSPRSSPRLSKARLAALIEEATTDAYGDAEQRSGFIAMLSEHVDLPFELGILGQPARVVAIVENEAGEVIAACRRGKESVRVSLFELPRPSVLPRGWEWIEAYRAWARGRG